MDTDDIIRLFKKGWALVLISIAINVVANLLGMSTLYKLLENVTINPMGALSGLFAAALMSLLFVFLIYPFVLGLAMEWIEKRIRR